MFYYLRNYYYISRFFNELKSISEERFETIKDFRLKAGFYEANLRKSFELTKRIQFKRHNQITLTYEKYLDCLYKDEEMKAMIINKYGVKTYNIFLRARDLKEKPSEFPNINKAKENSDPRIYANEIQKHLIDLGCTFTDAGHVSAMALRQDRSALDQAISFCVGAIAENYFENLIQLLLEGHTHLTKTTNKIKNYYEDGQISKLAYQSVITILGSCLNPNKTDEEKVVLESLIKQNYLEGEKLVVLTQ